jgi:hypothetical protein
MTMSEPESCHPGHRRDDSGCRMVSGFCMRAGNGGRGVTPVGNAVVCSFEFCLRMVRFAIEIRLS